MISTAKVTGAFLLAFCVIAKAQVDEPSELKKAPGWELVRAHCGACHSLQLVTSQRGDRAFWLKTIRWMQEKQNLWVLPEDQEDKILTYLSNQYAADAWGRRPPLPKDLMPLHAPSPDMSPEATKTQITSAGN